MGDEVKSGYPAAAGPSARLFSLEGVLAIALAAGGGIPGVRIAVPFSTAGYAESTVAG